MKSDRTQIAHLFRRAGFGATPEELDDLTEQKSYEEIVDELVNPEKCEHIDDSFVDRYYSGEGVPPYVGKWLFKMVNTKRPLEEKMALFLHHIFPVAWGKSEHGPSIFTEIDMFKRVGLTNFKNILLELSRDPAMIYWLDNNENHKSEINENYGRELLELFSMGVGNYTEDDIKNASRAFTGWTFSQPIPIYPQGHYPSRFEFHPEDHDGDEKSFLGHHGTFDGEDIIDIIVKEEATARFVSRHLCNFFVEDEPQVPAWNIEPPRDPRLVDHLAKIFSRSSGDMRAVLSELFNSDSFKNSINKPKVKSPTELLAGVLKQVGNYREIKPGLESYVGALTVMGQSLLNPPTVEGWHTGPEWIDSGTLSERINFASTEFSDDDTPGMKDIIQRAGSLDDEPSQLVDRCLDLLGGVQVSSTTHSELIQYVSELRTSEETNDLTDLIRMIVSTVDYQYA
jgi:uncharacterized protein (DUF1800 family)